MLTADLDPARAQERAAQAGPAVRWSSNPDAVLDDPEVDVVALLLPHHLHVKDTLAAVERGKHVLVEKPMALTLQDCAAMIQAAEAHERSLAVGQVLRFRDPYIFGRQVIAEGKIGRPVHAIRRRYAKRGGDSGQLDWVKDKHLSGGLLYGNGVHEIDAYLWLMNDRPTEVYAQAASLEAVDRRGGTELSVLIETELSGALNLTMSTGTSQSVWDFWAIGTDGDLYMAGAEVKVNGEPHRIPVQAGGGFVEEWHDFALSIRDGRTAKAAARSVWGTMVALECARVSVETGKPVTSGEVDSWKLYPQA